MVRSLAGSCAGSSNVKQEATEDFDINDISGLLVMKDTKVQLMKIRTAEVEAKCLRDQASTVKYAETLQTDLKEMVGKLHYVTNAVEKLL